MIYTTLGAGEWQSQELSPSSTVPKDPDLPLQFTTINKNLNKLDNPDIDYIIRIWNPGCAQCQSQLTCANVSS